MTPLLAGQAPGALVDLRSGSAWSTSALAREVTHRAEALAGRGVGAGARVVLAHASPALLLLDLLALWRLGACAVCLHPGLAARELDAILALVEPAGILAGARTLPGDPQCPRLDACGRVRRAHAAVVRAPAPADPALVLFTSGTTGAPKGVVHTFASLQARILDNHARIGGPDLARSLALLPLHFGHGLIGGCLTPLWAGGTVLLLVQPSMAELAGLGELLREHAISFLTSVPSMWRIVVKSSHAPRAATLARVHVGSAPLGAPLWRAISEWTGAQAVCNMYGMTETANWVAGASWADGTHEDGFVGCAWGAQVRVAGGGGAPARRGTGELLVRTPALMQGYFRRPDLSAAALVDGWYRTGDVAALGADGSIRLIGRCKEEINRAGVKVQPQEIDALLERHVAVLEACAFAVPDPVAGELVGVAVRAAAPHAGLIDELRRWCTQQIRAEAVPERWYLVAALPRSERGKIDRDAVRRLCLDRPRQPA